MSTKTIPWDAAEHLETLEDIVAYLEAAMEEGDADLIAAVLGDIMRSKVIAVIVHETEMDKES